MIRDGDVLLSVDGNPVRYRSVQELAALMLGAPGSESEFVFLRGEDRILVRLVRQPIPGSPYTSPM